MTAKSASQSSGLANRKRERTARATRWACFHVACCPVMSTTGNAGRSSRTCCSSSNPFTRHADVCDQAIDGQARRTKMQFPTEIARPRRRRTGANPGATPRCAVIIHTTATIAFGDFVIQSVPDPGDLWRCGFVAGWRGIWSPSDMRTRSESEPARILRMMLPR